MSRLVTKQTKWHVRPAKLRLPSLIRVFAVGMKKAWVLSYPNNKGADPHSLITAFVVHCLDSIIPV